MRITELDNKSRVVWELARHQASTMLAPYFSDMIDLLIPHVVEEGDDLAIDAQCRLTVGRGWFDKDDGQSDTRTDLARRITHMAEILVRDHHSRAGRYPDAKKASLASECEIAQNHAESVTPTSQRARNEEWIYPERFGVKGGGKVLEEYYDLIQDPPEDYQPSLDMSEDGSASGPPDPKSDGEDGSGGESDSGEGSGGEGDGQEGRASGKPQGRDKADIDVVRENVADAITQYAQSGCGNLPSDLLRWAEACKAPLVVPWHKALSTAASRAKSKRRGFSHYSYKSVARRQMGIGLGYGLPRLPKSYALDPQVDIYVDTSGSMSERELSTALGQVDHVFRGGTQVRVWAGDVGVAATGTAGKISDVAKLLVGGGGTDFVSVFDTWLKMPKKERPGTVFFFTDGGGPAPARNPIRNCKVYWILVGSHKMVPWKVTGEGDVDYGTIIKVPDGAVLT